jgi:hypothetical protein
MAGPSPLASHSEKPKLLAPPWHTVGCREHEERWPFTAS